MSSPSHQANPIEDSETLSRRLLAQSAFYFRVDGTSTAEPSLFATNRAGADNDSPSGSNVRDELVPASLGYLDGNLDYQTISQRSPFVLDKFQSYFSPTSYDRLFKALNLTSDGWYMGEGKAVDLAAEGLLCYFVFILGKSLGQKCLVFASPEGTIELAWRNEDGSRISVVVPGYEVDSKILICSDDFERGADDVREAAILVRQQLSR